MTSPGRSGPEAMRRWLGLRDTDHWAGTFFLIAVFTSGPFAVPANASSTGYPTIHSLPPAGTVGTGHKPTGGSSGGNGGNSALPAIAAGIVALVAINHLLKSETEQPAEQPDGEGRTAEDRLEEFSGDGPETPAVFNMSAFVVRGPVKGNWPLVLDYEQRKAGRVEIRVSARGAPNI